MEVQLVIEGNYSEPTQQLELFLWIAQSRPCVWYVIAITELSSDFGSVCIFLISRVLLMSRRHQTGTRRFVDCLLCARTSIHHRSLIQDDLYDTHSVLVCDHYLLSIYHAPVCWVLRLLKWRNQTDGMHSSMICGLVKKTKIKRKTVINESLKEKNILLVYWEICWKYIGGDS